MSRDTASARNVTASATLRGWGLRPPGSGGPSLAVPFSTAVVSQMVPPSITGDDQPRPGSSVRQRMFCPSWTSRPTGPTCQVTGRSVAAGACPWPSGPRH